MPADPAHQLALAQLRDTETAIPVSSTEEQTSVVGHHQHLGADLHPGGEWSTQETLHPAPKGRDREDQSELVVRWSRGLDVAEIYNQHIKLSGLQGNYNFTKKKTLMFTWLFLPWFIVCLCDPRQDQNKIRPLKHILISQINSEA